jgi:hypothetical protein
MLVWISTHSDIIIKFVSVLIPIAVHLVDRLWIGLWVRVRRVLVALAVVSSLVFVYFAFFQASKVNEALFIIFLGFWGGAVYSLIVELLRAGLGVHWSRTTNATKSNKWVRRFEYPVLLLTILGLIVTINRLPVIDGAALNDLVGPIILMTAATIKFAKTRAEIGDWHLLDKDGWKKVW